MSDKPVCSKCGGERVSMKNAKGVWFLGCPTCRGIKKPAPPSPKPVPKKPDDEPKKKGNWLDDYL